MATWRCPHCEATLREGNRGKANVEYRKRQDEAGNEVKKNGRPTWNAHCGACGELAHELPIKKTSQQTG